MATASPHGCWSRFKHDQDAERAGQQHGRDDHRAVAVAALDLAEDVQRAVLVESGRLPAIITTLPNSPRARLNDSAAPVRIAGQSVGSVTRRKVVHGPGAQGGGGLLLGRSISSRTGCTLRITNG